MPQDEEVLDTELNKWISTKTDDIEIGLSSSEDTIKKAQLLEEYYSKKQDREQRKQFSFWIFVFVCVYMVLALIILILSGCEVLEFSNGVIVALLTTTTANVIGLFAVVAKYLFHPKN
jgi:hypothetical protein